MAMTLIEYINNPMGGRVMTQKDMYKASYTEKFDKLLLRENGKIEYHLFHSGDRFVIYFKMPSESLQGMYYDIILEFTPKNNDAKVENDLKNYNVRFFSNDRAFIFTYAYAFKQHRLLISDFESKLGIAVKVKPEKTNPKLLVGYIKEFYFAYLVMNQKGLFNKVMFTSNLHAYSPSALKSKIASGQEKTDEYDKLKAAEIKHKRANKVSNKGEQISPTTFNKDFVGKKAKPVSKISKIGHIPKTMFKSAIKKIKTIKKK